MRLAYTTALLIVTLLLLGNTGYVGARDNGLLLVGWVLVPAVESSGRGSLVNVTIEIRAPGSGIIRVVGEGGESNVDETTRTSMIMGVKTGSLYAGYYWGSFDAVVTIKTREEVAGPSGGFAVALLTYMMLAYTSNTSIGGFVVTGAIAPDGLSSRVGGVDVKCSVAQQAGYTLILPLANRFDVGPACRSMVPVAGLFSALKALRGMPEVNITTSYPLPEAYNSGMRSVALNLIKSTEEIMRGLTRVELPWPREWIVGNMTRARNIVEEHPYAAASLSFIAYIMALQSQYYINITTMGDRGLQWARDEVSRLEAEVRTLKLKLDGSPRDGSVFYIEFLATAYSRLADANSTLLTLRQLFTSMNPSDIAYNLGFAKARLETVSVWLSIAESMRGESPRVDEGTVKTLTLIFGDYVRSTVSYASELIKYIISNYPISQAEREFLATRLAAVESIRDRGDSELSKGNYLAALGFYREALSKSLAWLFARPDVLRPEVVDGYVRELLNLQALMTSTLASRGLVSGLSQAYADYAMVRYRFGDLEASVDLLEEAVASTILWYMLTLKTLYSNSLIQATPQIIPQTQMLQPSDEINFYVVVVLSAILAFLLGVTISSWLSYRMMRVT